MSLKAISLRLRREPLTPKIAVYVQLILQPLPRMAATVLAPSVQGPRRVGEIRDAIDQSRGEAMGWQSGSKGAGREHYPIIVDIQLVSPAEAPLPGYVARPQV